ncbi:unnamed protein product [Gulo gulo]|uniref:Uncharacterized protein n=1 Tax=Gulo gulo TaxID=48420 RepID=A0A9X9LUM6_GULGU|nr:unnamed protein product [Gulo gulo]
MPNLLGRKRRTDSIHTLFGLLSGMVGYAVDNPDGTQEPRCQ